MSCMGRKSSSLETSQATQPYLKDGSVYDPLRPIQGYRQRGSSKGMKVSAKALRSCKSLPSRNSVKSWARTKMTSTCSRNRHVGVASVVYYAGRTPDTRQSVTVSGFGLAVRPHLRVLLVELSNASLREQAARGSVRLCASATAACSCQSGPKIGHCGCVR